MYITIKVLGTDYKIEGLEDGKLGEVLDSDNNKITGEMEKVVKAVYRDYMQQEVNRLIADLREGKQEAIDFCRGAPFHL